MTDHRRTFISAVWIGVDRVVLGIVTAIVVAIGRIEGIKKVPKRCTFMYSLYLSSVSNDMRTFDIVSCLIQLDRLRATHERHGVLQVEI